MCYKWPVSAAESDNRQPLSKNQLGIALLVLVLIIAVGVGLYFLLHKSSKHGGGGPTGAYKPFPAKVFATSAQLAGVKAKIGGETFYYAGPRSGFEYEFRRISNGNAYVRYLPSGSRAGIAGDFLVISTYPGYNLPGLQAQAKAAGAQVKHARGGGFYFVNPKRPRSVYMAWNNVDAQVEVFAPTPVEAVQVAKTGKIVPVR